MSQSSYAERLVDDIARSPTPYHAVSVAKRTLRAAGFGDFMDVLQKRL